jgi:hypothetical protein
MDRGLLEFLRAGARPAGRRYRNNPRQEADIAARLAWGHAPARRDVAARLVDIGRRGAALLTADPPPMTTRVRVRLLGLEPTPWLEAEVLAVEPAGASHRVRLRFPESCPTVFLKAAVLGVAGPELGAVPG